jgi:hypothetical protein
LFKIFNNIFGNKIANSMTYLNCRSVTMLFLRRFGSRIFLEPKINDAKK